MENVEAKTHLCDQQGLLCSLQSQLPEKHGWLRDSYNLNALKETVYILSRTIM